MYWNVLKDSFSNLISVAKEAKSSSFGTESAITSTIIKTWFCIPSDTTLTVTFRCTGDWLQIVVERMHCLASHRRHSFLTLQEYKSKLLRSKLDVRSLMSQRKFWKKNYNLQFTNNRTGNINWRHQGTAWRKFLWSVTKELGKPKYATTWLVTNPMFCFTKKAGPVDEDICSLRMFSTEAKRISPSLWSRHLVSNHRMGMRKDLLKIWTW